MSREARSCVASATKLEETQEDDEMRTWLRLELEEGVVVTPTQKIEDKTEGRQSDLETSGGIPSSNGRLRREILTRLIVSILDATSPFTNHQNHGNIVIACISLKS